MGPMTGKARVADAVMGGATPMPAPPQGGAPMAGGMPPAGGGAPDQKEAVLQEIKNTFGPGWLEFIEWARTRGDTAGGY